MRSFPVVVGAVSLVVAAIPSLAQQPVVRASTRPTVVRFFSQGDSTRAALGLSTTSGGKRDTLGVLVTSIVSGSPAEKAGLEEGDRLAGINGTSLQLAPADAGDPAMNGLMGRRLQREMRKVKPGDVVHLRVYANGQFKTMDVKAASEADVFANEGWRSLLDEAGEVRAVPAVPPEPPMAPMRPMRPMPPMPPSYRDDRAMVERERALRRAEQGMRDAERRMRTMQYDFDGRRRGFGGMNGRISVDRHDDSITATASGNSYVLRVHGVQLAPVNSGLASYFGSRSANGLLVLSADSSTGLRAGDVILKVNGKSVRDGDTARISLSTRQDNKVQVLRKGKLQTVTLKDD